MVNAAVILLILMNYYFNDSTATMTRKCCVKGCNGNDGKPENKEPVFRLPKDPEEKQRWINSIPRDNIPDTAHTVVCERHWDPGYETIYKNGVKRPKYEPNVSSCVKQSLIPTKQPSARTTKRTSSEVRNIIPDELEEFILRDKITNFEVLCRKLCDNDIPFPFQVVKYSIGDVMIIQSTSFKGNSAIPSFLLKVKHDLSYEAFHCGFPTPISSLSTNRI